MVTINNEEILNTYHYLLTIKNIVERDFVHVQKNKSYLDNLVPQELENIYSQKYQTAMVFIDGTAQLLKDFSLVSLVTAFEKAVFAKYRTSYGVLRTVVKDQAEQPLDFFDSRERFINDNIDRLAGILFLIDGIIDRDTMETLKQIKEHRNYIVHGKRDSAPPAFEFDIDTIAKTLDNAVAEISQ